MTITNGIQFIQGGTVTTPAGYRAGATRIGLKTIGEDALDLGILCSDVQCTAAGVFTTNRIKAAPVVLCQRRLEDARAQALVANSGCANACTGPQGASDAEEMAFRTAEKLGLPVEDVLVASTGVIGDLLPMDRVRAGIQSVLLSEDGGHSLARAIMTTDTQPKEAALRYSTVQDGPEFTIAGIAKGSGMIHPNLATMLCFLTTDAAVAPAFLKTALKHASDASFNMVTVDGDTSPNDSVIILANGLTGNQPVEAGSAQAEAFETALTEVCIQLAKSIARDGEGATKLIEVIVEGAATVEDARRASRTIAGSSLVKTAIHGSDPNWGRIVAALGRSGVPFDDSTLDLHVRDACLLRSGCAQRFDKREVTQLLDGPEVLIRVCIKSGGASATAWGCDMSPEYVRLNSEYTT